MKIHPDKLTHLQDAETKKTENKQGADFQDLLKNEIQKGESSGLSPGRSSASPLQGADPYFQLRAVQSAELNNRQAVMDKLDSLLSRWDDYTSSLRSARPDLRKADQVLEDISQQLSQVRSNLGEGDTQDQGLNTMLDELEILTVTERIKFNRGDYI
ncbi:MAG: hypothetical protein ACOC0U_06930 [Desulfovibrionales bacterium]